jgi:hypothetical protein
MAGDMATISLTMWIATEHLDLQESHRKVETSSFLDHADGKFIQRPENCSPS